MSEDKGSLFKLPTYLPSGSENTIPPLFTTRPPATPNLDTLFFRNFGELVLGCIDSYDGEQRRILQHFSISRRFSFLSENFTKKLNLFCAILAPIPAKFAILLHFIAFRTDLDENVSELQECLKIYMLIDTHFLRQVQTTHIFTDSVRGC